LSFFAIDSGGGAPFTNAFNTGFAMRDRLFGASPETSVYLFADAAFGGIDDLSLRFGGIFDYPLKLKRQISKVMIAMICRINWRTSRMRVKVDKMASKTKKDPKTHKWQNVESKKAILNSYKLDRKSNEGLLQTFIATRCRFAIA
jgi:hypothetical protein